MCEWLPIVSFIGVEPKCVLVCMSVFMHSCVYVGLYLCILVCFVHICACVCGCSICVYFLCGVGLHVNECVCVCVCMYVCVLLDWFYSMGLCVFECRINVCVCAHMWENTCCERR